MDGAILPVIPNHPTHRPDRFPEHLTLSDGRRADRVRLEAFLPVTGELVQPLGGRAEPGEYHHLPRGRCDTIWIKYYENIESLN